MKTDTDGNLEKIRTCPGKTTAIKMMARNK
jgi:hypothetical protein